MTGGQGYISSPGYPGYYYSDRDYYWRITVPEGKRVQVKFFDFGFPYSITCPGDFLKVYDGKRLTMPHQKNIIMEMFDLLHSIQLEDICISISDLIHLL